MGLLLTLKTSKYRIVTKFKRVKIIYMYQLEKNEITLSAVRINKCQGLNFEQHKFRNHLGQLYTSEGIF